MSQTVIIAGAGIGIDVVGPVSDPLMQAILGLGRDFRLGKDLMPVAHGLATYSQGLGMSSSSRRTGLSFGVSGLTPLYVFLEGGVGAHWNFKDSRLEPCARVSIDQVVPLPKFLGEQPVLGIGLFATVPDLLEIRRDGAVAGVQLFVPVGL